MLEITESFGWIHQALKDTLQNMKPKENSDQRNSNPVLFLPFGLIQLRNSEMSLFLFVFVVS